VSKGAPYIADTRERASVARHKLTRSSVTRVALVQWHGGIGGAEVLTVELARAFREVGVLAEVVIVTCDGPVTARLEGAGIPYRVLGFRRGRDILRHPRMFTAGVSMEGLGGVILPACGFIGASLRLGGYGGPIIAVEHGDLLQARGSRLRELLKRVSRVAGALADDMEVGVSDFVVEELRAVPHARHLRRIYNGVDPKRFGPLPGRPSASSGLVIGFAGRLIPGKGVDHAIRAVALACARAEVRLLIAGDGPERPRLESLAREMGVATQVEFLGMLSEVDAFWQRCGLAIFPSQELIESFGMSVLEAMASSRPVVVTNRGAYPELVLDGVTGKIVRVGDVEGLADALIAYANSSELRSSHGAAGRERALASFDIAASARAYIGSLEEVATRRSRLALRRRGI